MKPASTKKQPPKTQAQLAADYHVSERTVRSWEKEGAPLANAGEMAVWIKERRSRLTADKPAMEGLKLRRLELQCDILQREKDEAEGRLLKADVWLDKMKEHISALRQAVRNVLLLEQPSTLSGRGEADIREINQKTYNALCRRMQNAAGKLSVPGQPPIEVLATDHSQQAHTDHP